MKNFCGINRALAAKKKIFLFMAALWMAAAGTVKADNAIITDGNFNDWKALSNVAHCAKSDNSTYDYLLEAKFVRDNDSIYFYLEFDDEQDDFDIGEGTFRGYYAHYTQFVLNCGDETTGCAVSWYFDDPALDLLIDGTWTDLFKDAILYSCPAALNGLDNDNWDWDDTGVSNFITCCTSVKLANGRRAIEGSISISKLPVKPTSVLKMGVIMLDAGWSESGALPENSMATGQAIPGKLITVPLLNGGSTDLPLETASQRTAIRKFFKNGQLLIERDGKTYNAQGAEVR